MPPVVYEGRLIQLAMETVELPGGRALELEIVRHPGGAVICAVDDSARVCLLRQYRHASREGTIWELPAGCIDAQDPSPKHTAVRELAEEAGIHAQRWRELGFIYPTPGFCDEILHLYLAQDLTSVASAHQEDEVIEVHWLPFADAVTMALDGRIRDAKTIIGLLRAQPLLAPAEAAHSPAGAGRDE